MSVLTTRTIQRTWWGPLPRLRLAPTLIAALLMAVLFGGALLLFNARGGDTPAAPGAPSGGDGNQPAAIQRTATATATPLPSFTPVPDQPDDATATPFLPTAIPPEGAEAMPPASEPSQVVITATPVPVQLDNAAVPAEGAEAMLPGSEPSQVVITATPVPFEGPAIEVLDPTMVPPPLAPSVSLEGVRYEAQGWNNAGPATLAMALSVVGWDGSQQTAARWLKPDSEDKSVSPWQMVAYVNGQTPYRAIYRMGGTLEVLKSAVAAGFPVIAAVEMDTESDGWFGHYQLVTGYDEAAGVLLVYDSYLGPTTEPRRVPFSEFDAAWWPFNRTFVVMFDAAQASGLQPVLLGYDDPAYGVRMAHNAAWTATIATPEDKWGWFNLGTAYTTLGRFEDAAAAYDQALDMDLPFRALWYQFGPFEAYFGAGRYDDVLALCASMLDVTPYVEEVYYWQALAYAAQGEVRDARRALEQLIALNPNFLVGELARFQTAPDALAQELFGSVTLAQEAGQPTLLLTLTFTPQGTPLIGTKIRIDPVPMLVASDTPVPTIVPPVTAQSTPTLPPTLTPSGTPIVATPIRVEPTPTLPPMSTPVPAD